MMGIFKKLIGSKTTSVKEGGIVKLTNSRIQGRLYGYAWTIIEKRDPKFDREKLKTESIGMLMILSLAFAKDNECSVMTKLMELMDKAPRSKSENEETREGILGGLEGKLVIYNDLAPEVLLKNREIK